MLFAQLPFVLRFSSVLTAIFFGFVFQGEARAGTCNQPPVPAPGENVVWVLDDSPFQVCDDFTIPATSQVSIEAGVLVDFDASRQITLLGSMLITGTESLPVTFDVPFIAPPFIAVSGGELTGQYVTVNGGQVLVSNGGTVQFSDSQFSASPCLGCFNGSIRTVDTFGQVAPPFVGVERSHFLGSGGGAGINLVDGLASLRGNTFEDAGISVLRGHVDLMPGDGIGSGANVVASGGALAISRQESVQTLPIDALEVSGISSGPGLRLEGGQYYLGSGVTSENNLYPLRLRGGLTADSDPIFSGNVRQVIDVAEGGFAGSGLWPNLGLVYRVTEVAGDFPGGHLRISPGVTVEFANPNADFRFRSGRRGDLHGLPNAPITLRGFNGGSWEGLRFQNNGNTGPRIEHVHIEGAEIGLRTSGTRLIADRIEFRNNFLGAETISFGTRFRGVRFANNSIGLRFPQGGSPLLNSPADPNSFEANSVAVEVPQTSSSMDARNTWWGDATGPQHPDNPDGQGQAITGPGAAGVLIDPWLLQAPDAITSAPVVRMQGTGGADVLESGTSFVLNWELPEFGNQAAVSSQRIEYANNIGIGAGTILAAEVPPDARSWTITVPEWVFTGLSSPPGLQVVAVDELGREALDRRPLRIIEPAIPSGLAIADDQAGAEFFGGREIPDMEWNGSVGSSTELRGQIVFENDGYSITGLTTSNAILFFAEFPFVSSDRVRLVLEVVQGGGSDTTIERLLGGYFSVRHDPRLGYEPPTVELLSPAPDSILFAGQVLDIAWQVDAPEGLRELDLMASYDGARTWHPVITGISPEAEGVGWRLPANGGIEDLRVRVVARDVRFQNSSAESGVLSVLVDTEIVFADGFE